MISFPNLKINLGLHVISKRSDGFHNIETLMIPVDRNDILEFVESEMDHDEITITGHKLDSAPEENLIMKALRLIRKYHSIPPLNIHLHKIIPSGAGLGGGSSDAAHMLLMLNEYFNIGLNKKQLLNIASELGSDCSFFIFGKPCIARGKGDMLEPVEIYLDHFTLILLKPDIHISTKEAYVLVKPHEPAYPLSDIIKKDTDFWTRELKNDFEPGIFRKYPVLRELKSDLYELGASYASMSGSGSSVYGLFTKQPCLPARMEKIIVFKGKL